MSALLSVLIGFCVVVGLFFMSVGVIGILRFPDVYTRLHADTKATTFGSLFLGLASALCVTQAWVAGEGGEPTAFWIHAAFAVVVLAVTNAAGGHAIARAAWRAGQRPVGVVDQLGTAEEETPVEAGEEKEVLEAGEEAGEAKQDGPEGLDGPEGPDADEGLEATVGTGDEAAGDDVKGGEG